MSYFLMVGWYCKIVPISEGTTLLHFVNSKTGTSHSGVCFAMQRNTFPRYPACGLQEAEGHMEIIQKSISEIHPYENNPRHNERAVEYVANSIREFGFRVPILIDEAGTIIAGHTRLQAAEKLGIDKVPTIEVKNLTQRQIKALRLVDNRTAELSAWDYTALDEELADLMEITGIDMEQFGFMEMDYTDIERRIDELDTEAGEKPPGEKQERTITCPYYGEEFTI